MATGFRILPIVNGLTIVAFGTSIPGMVNSAYTLSLNRIAENSEPEVLE